MIITAFLSRAMATVVPRMKRYYGGGFFREDNNVRVKVAGRSDSGEGFMM